MSLATMSKFTCDHSKNCDVKVNPLEWHVRTPLSQAAYRSCIKCMQKHIGCLNALSKKKRKTSHLSSFDSACTFAMECMAQSQNISIAHKFNALMWGLSKGFHAPYEVFEFAFPFSVEQLASLTKLGAFPYGTQLQRYADAGLWNEIKAIQENLPLTYINAYMGIEESTDFCRKQIAELLYPHETPTVVREVLLSGQIIKGSDEFVPKAVIDRLILPFLL